MRIFVIASKTDKTRQGQWVTILASSNPASAYQSLPRVLRILQQRWDSLPVRVQEKVSKEIGADWLDLDEYHPIPLANLHIMIEVGDHKRARCRQLVTSRDNVSFLFAAPVSRDHHSKDIKEACALIGLDPKMYASHSCRSGNTTEQEFLGVPDELQLDGGR